jgi:hypothetical protein
MITDDEVVLGHGLEYSCAEAPLALDNFDVLIQKAVRRARLCWSIAAMGSPWLFLSVSDNFRTSCPDLQ